LSTTALLVLTTCATVDRDPVGGCQDDSDCGPNEVCSLAQGNICVTDELPPLAAIGFEIIESADLRVELLGCDPEVGLELGGSELRVQKRSDMINEYRIRAATRRSVANCGGDDCAGVCDEQALTCSEPTDADLTLTMDSRLGLSERRSKKSFVTATDPPTPAGQLPPPQLFGWPTYESEDPRAHAALVLDVTPTAEMNTLSSFRRVIGEDAELEIDAVGVHRCERGLYGSEQHAVQTLTGSPVIGATIEFRYAEEIATPATVIGTPPSCEDDDGCPSGWACNEQEGTCGLDLTGVLAGSTVSTEAQAGGYPEAWVYTYCEETVASMEPIERKFEVTVAPPTDSGLPTVLYSLSQDFLDPNPFRQVEVQSKLCLPDWQPPHKVAFTVAGEPVELIETELGEYRCCSTECLPSTEPGVEPTPPPNVDSCSSFTTIRFESRWFNPINVVEWLIAGCLPTASYPDGANGKYVRDGVCDESGCSVGLTAGSADDSTRDYSVAISQPVGSVFRSQRFDVQITPETAELGPFELLPRVLLRGQITCVEQNNNCEPTNAVVLAERLRVETDEPDPPGPFLFDARSNASGNFVLPLDPGVYVITAYPAVGRAGGPAPFRVVDLREDSSLIEFVDGVPNATLSDPLELDEGILVRVALSGFELSTDVRPFDTGSWKAQPDFPYDLNDPQTCYATDAAGQSARRGCSIRRLRPTDTPISLLITKRFQFTARSRGGDSCE